MNPTRLILAAGMSLCLASVALAQEAGPIVITEIMYNPSGVDQGQEWVELYNPTAAAVDVSRWRLVDDDGQTDRFPTGSIIPAGGIAVVLPVRGGVSGNGSLRHSTYTNSAASFAATWGTGVQLIFVDSFWNYPADSSPPAGTLDGLSNSPSPTNELLRLVNNSGIVIDQVNYDDDEDAVTPWPDDNDSGSIQLLRDLTNRTDNNFGSAWRLSGPGDGLNSRHATPGSIAFSGLNSWGTPGQLPTQLTVDCNSNTQNDAVEITHGTAVDSYPFNNIPDLCEGDCNANAVGDLTEIALDWTLDKNLNHALDLCEINQAGGVGGIGGTLDTNNNGVLDSFENKPNVMISEILYDPAGEDDGKEFVEIYNVGATPVDISGWRLQDIEGDPATGSVPAGTIMQPGEVIVLMAGGGLGIPSDIVAQFRTAWSIPGNVRVFGLTPWQDRAQQATDIDEVLALEDASGAPVDVVNYQNREFMGGSPWPYDDGVSSIAVRPNSFSKSANDFGASWMKSTTNMNGARDSLQTGFFNDSRDTGSSGSPGIVWTATEQTPTGEAVITEIMYNPNSDPGDNTLTEWIEVFNPNASPLDLSGWYLRDEDGHTGTVPNGTVLAPSSVMILLPRGVLPASTAEFNFRAAWGDVCNVVALSGWSDQEAVPNIGGLSNSPSLGDEILTLRKANGTVVDIVNFNDDGVTWPADAATAAPGLGASWSIYLLPGHYDAVQNDVGQNWAAASIGFDQGMLNTTTLTYNGLDIGSPGLLEGVVATQPCFTGPTCDSIDFNNDTSFFDPQDIDAFLSVYSEGPCIPDTANCNDIDFNNDTSVFDPCDIDSFLVLYSEGPCTPCGQ
ncbi:MAG: lamin tail domain-containing protein [Phycisphaerales bacterium]